MPSPLISPAENDWVAPNCSIDSGVVALTVFCDGFDAALALIELDAALALIELDAAL